MTDKTLHPCGSDSSAELASMQAEPKGDKRDYRKELWIGVAISVAGASNCNNSSSPASWANTVLAAFDRQFKDAR